LAAFHFLYYSATVFPILFWGCILHGAGPDYWFGSEHGDMVVVPDDPDDF